MEIDGLAVRASNVVRVLILREKRVFIFFYIYILV